MWRLLAALIDWARQTTSEREAWKRERALLDSLEPIKDVRRFQ